MMWLYGEYNGFIAGNGLIETDDGRSGERWIRWEGGKLWIRLSYDAETDNGYSGFGNTASFICIKYLAATNAWRFISFSLRAIF